MKRPMEHYLDDLRPVLHFAATNYQEQRASCNLTPLTCEIKL